MRDVDLETIQPSPKDTPHTGWPPLYRDIPLVPWWVKGIVLVVLCSVAAAAAFWLTL